MPKGICISPFLFYGGNGMKRKNKENYFALSILMLIFMAYPNTTFAALPWEGPLVQLQTSLTGPVAKAVCAIVVCCSGLFVALGEAGQFGRLCGRLVFGLALAVGFMQIISLF